MKKYSFFFHYNKPASKSAGRNKLTVHWKGKCHLVDGVNCHTQVFSVDRKTQPHCILKGISNQINIIKNKDKNIAYIW
jgi:hypothetical protein